MSTTAPIPLRGMPDVVEPDAPNEEAAEKERRRIAALEERFDNTSAAKFLGVAPPERAWVIPGFIPSRIGALLVAAGGTGKGHYTIAMALDIALGRAFGPFRAVGPQGVMLVSLEDGVDEMHRRVDAAITARWPDGLSAAERGKLERHLHVVDLVGVRTTLDDQELQNHVIEKASEMGGCSLVVLDPLAKLIPEGVDMWRTEGAGMLHAAIDGIVRATGATVLVVHHTTKEAQRTGAELQQTAATGSAQIIDLARLAIHLRPMGLQQVRQHGLPADGSYVELGVAKQNYAAALGAPFVMRRVQGGALVYQQASSRAEVAAERVLAVMREVGEPMFAGEIEEAVGEDDISEALAREARTLLEEQQRIRQVSAEAPDRTGRRQRRPKWEVVE